MPETFKLPPGGTYAFPMIISGAKTKLASSYKRILSGNIREDDFSSVGNGKDAVVEQETKM